MGKRGLASPFCFVSTRFMIRADAPGRTLPGDDRWLLWRDVVLRGTGFPVSALALLADPGLGRNIDEWLRAEALLVDASARARRLCYARLANCAADRRSAWRSTMRRLKQGRLPPRTGDEEFDQRVDELSRARTCAENKRAAFDCAHAAARRATTDRLRRWAMDDGLREAVAWQNTPAVHTALDLLTPATEAAERTSGSARRELLVARYLQRYAAKNDTIGFFGPVAWAEIRGESPGVDMRAGAQLTADARAVVEPWAVAVLALAIAEDPAMRADLRPCRHPALRLGDMPGNYVLLERAFRLPSLERAVLELCDGERTVARVLDAASHADTRAEADAALDRLLAASLVSLVPRVPVTVDALGRLREHVDALPRGAARDGWLQTIDALQRAASDAGRAHRKPNDLLQVLQRAADDFTRATQRSPYRSAAAATSGRSLLCLDTTRDLELTIGEPLAREVARALRPVLDAAYWFSCQVHAQLEEFAGSLFDEHARGGAIALDALWLELQRRGEAVEAIVDDVVEQLAERWSEATVETPPAEIESRAADVFGDPAAGWPGARFQAPDVMIAAASAAELPEALFVLGELHPADRSLMREVFAARHPDRAALQRSIEAALSEPELRPLIRTRDPQARMRTMPEAGFMYDIECDTVVSQQPPQRVLRSGELWVERSGNAMRIIDRSSQREFPWRAFLGPQAGGLSSQRFRLYAPVAHRPRMTIGRLVVAREAWRLDLAPLTPWRRLSSRERYVEVRRLARSLGWPRWIFYRLPGEPKPLYLDLDSLCFVELFARMASAAASRGISTVDITEMLPTPEQCWLSDCRGERYTSEWRMLFFRGAGTACAGA